jgi:hypothetical protein
LTSTDNHGQRHIALIALDRFLGDSETELVAEVAEQVIRNSDFDSVESQIAFKILEQRNNERAQQLLDEIAQAARNAMIVTKEPAEIQQTPALQKAQTHIVKAMGRIGGNLVYIQFSDGTHRKVIENLAKELRKEGYRVPGIERLDFERNDVRYFSSEDRQTAIDVAEIVEKSLTIKLKITDLTQSNLRAPKGLVEVWIGTLELSK